jgi:2-iminobutanoate/2-iminopropanoate deaminase
MTRQVIRTENAPSSPLYSQAVKAGPHVYVSGMVGVDPSTRQIVGTTVAEQTRQALRNCSAILAAAGAGLDDVVQVTVLLADPADFAAMNEEYAKAFASDPPARAVAKLGAVIPNVLVSIQMTAYTG